MYLIVIAWGYQDLDGALIEVQERQQWSDADVSSLEMTWERKKSWDKDVERARESFQKKGLPTQQIRECFQNLPVYPGGMQFLADFLKMSVIVYATPDSCQTIPEFRFRCDPAA